MEKTREPYVHIKVVRHEKSDKTKGADRPTADGFKAAYERGIALREENPDQIIRGYYSNKARSQICLGAWLDGAGSLQVRGRSYSYQPFAQLSNALNPVTNTPSEIKEAREGGADASYTMGLWLGKYAKLVEPCAEAMRKHIVKILQDIPSGGIILNVSHTPVVEASLLRLMGEELDSKRLEDIIGRSHFAEGTGYDVACEFTIATIDKPKIYVAEKTFETNIDVEKELGPAFEYLASL
ncbi:hypothetical protein KY343_00400 [Candidatus Woesearchaeota archaeon]|nr:hypothetical protein [Candidatus Woesearchaeota archaeon]